MSRVTAKVTFEIEIPDKRSFLEAVARYYEEDIQDITDDDVHEFIDHHLNKRLTSTSNTFNVMGIETDGPFLCSVNKEKILTYDDEGELIPD